MKMVSLTEVFIFCLPTIQALWALEITYDEAGEELQVSTEHPVRLEASMLPAHFDMKV